MYVFLMSTIRASFSVWPVAALVRAWGDKRPPSHDGGYKNIVLA